MEKIRKEQVLGLDIGTFCGYYSHHESGVWNFTPAMKRNDCKTYLTFYRTLKTFIQLHGIRKIVTEDINFNSHNTDYRKLNELRGIIKLVTEELDLLPVEFVNVRVLKKWAVGTGDATKAQMIAACQNHYRLQPTDDNHADACHLYHYYLRKWRVF